MKVNSRGNKNQLTTSQFTFIVFGTIVGVGVLSLPNGVVKAAHQDGWISALIGAIYPLYIVITATYVAKKVPNGDIIILTKKYFGKYLGGLFNFILFTYYIFFSTMIASYYTNLMRSFVLGFLTSFKVLMIFFLIVAYAASRGGKSIGVISKITFYITVVLIISPVAALKVGLKSNILPVFDSGFKAILAGSWQSTFAYTGAEIIFLIYPLVKDRSKIFISSILNVVIITLIYVWVVFITIVYLGPDIVNTSYWSFLLVTDSVTITIINNFRYLFILLWSIVALRSCTIYLYGGMHIIKNYLSEKAVKKVYFLLYPSLVYLAIKYGNEVKRQSISNMITQFYIIFNLAYITIITAFVVFKERDKH